MMENYDELYTEDMTGLVGKDPSLSVIVTGADEFYFRLILGEGHRLGLYDADGVVVSDRYDIDEFRGTSLEHIFNAAVKNGGAINQVFALADDIAEICNSDLDGGACFHAGHYSIPYNIGLDQLQIGLQFGGNPEFGEGEDEITGMNDAYTHLELQPRYDVSLTLS